MTHFYLTLPSNSSQEFFPDNTLTEFTTKLASTIELTSEWEVGLAEIMFPRSWYTIPKDGLTIVADYRQCDIARKCERDRKFQRGEDASEDEMGTTVEIKSNGGFFNTMHELTQELNQASIGAFASSDADGKVVPPVFYYKTITRRMYITIPAGMSLEFPLSLESILGLSEDQNPMCNMSNDKMMVKGDLSCDLQTAIHALYVYYELPRYIPIQKKSFDTVEITIRDDLGEKIQFESGKVLLTLHFRRSQNQYLI